mgnify:CR=1 FL=1
MSSGLYNTHKIDFDTTLDLTRLKPYGDTMNDGKVQTSFTLPVKDDERGEEAARQIAKKMGLEEPNVAYHAALDKEFTFYVVYGSCVHSVNYEDIHVITVESDVMSMEDTNDYIREHIGRKVVMVGASTGTDAHTVGIDAIMNRKGFAGHYGLERYEMIEAYNLGSQVPNEEFIKKALELHADVLLVSQTVTQKDVHIGASASFLITCGLIAFFFPRQVGLADSTLFSSLMPRLQGVRDELHTGAVLFCAVFLLNEPYTCAHHRMGRILYGVLVGVVSMGFRYYGVYETGVCFAVLAVNSISAWIDRTEVRLYRLLHYLPASGAGKEAAE